MARVWVTANTNYDGFPIYFRRPEILVSEIDVLNSEFSILLTITHTLEQVKDNGLPADGYNDSLESFDMLITEPFDDETLGIVALIETYAGKRKYYVYASDKLDLDKYRNSITSRFPKEKLRWQKHDDSGWQLFHGYAREFNFA